MANQQWNTDGNLGSVNEGEEFSRTITYSLSSNLNKKTLKPIVLSSNLPDSFIIDTESYNTAVNLSGKMPEVFNDIEYGFTLRLKEVDEETYPPVITDITDRYFTITNKNLPVEWNEEKSYTIECYQDTSFNVELSNWLKNKNGNEVFKKSNGDLPDGLFFTENGNLYGIPYEENLTEDKEYKFKVKVYVDGEEIPTVEEKEFTLYMFVDVEDKKPQWVSEENIGNVNKNDELTKSSGIALVATDVYGGPNRKLYYRIIEPVEEVIPTGLTFSKDGVFRGRCVSSQIKDWYFNAQAYVEDSVSGEIDYGEIKKFFISTNMSSSYHNIEWFDKSKTYDIGTFTIGEEISGMIPKATVEDGTTLEYSFSGEGYPKGLQLSSDGILYGTIDYQNDGLYEFEIMVKSPYLYTTRKFSIKLKKGLSYKALDLYLRINLEYKNEYNDIKNQLNPRTKYNTNISNYVVDSFPKIDVATLKCFDKQILASMLNFGNPEILRFGLTKYVPYSHVDSNNTITEDYEVYYKSINENTYQWDKIDCGDYPFDKKLEELKETDEYADVELNTKLDFNNEIYNTDVPGWKIIGTTDSYTKLMSYNTSAIKPGYYAKVLDDDRLFITKGSVGYYKFTDDYKWEYAGSTIPKDVYATIHTHPSDSYEIFNFENVRKILSTPVYVYKKYGKYFYDIGNQQIMDINIPTNEIPTKLLYPFVKVTTDYVYGGSKRDVLYYICDENGNNIEHVKYENHIVQAWREIANGIYGWKILTNTLFIPSTMISIGNYIPDNTSQNFMILERNGEVYIVNEIENPFCYDSSNTKNQFDIFENEDGTGVGTVELGQEMVMPNITSEDIEHDSNGDNYVVFLDTNIEPLPMWKREQPELWKPNTTYKSKTIIFYDSLYYKAKQQFTSGSTFVYDENVLEIIKGDEININLPKKYFPTLDLGYYQKNTNRQYLSTLNKKELKGDYWYRKDFFFWELIAKPVYDASIDIFGIPFYSNKNRLIGKTTNQRDLTFKLTNKTPGADIHIYLDNVEYTDGQKHQNYTVRNNVYTITNIKPGSKIKWTASKEKYFPEGEEYIITSDEECIVNLQKECKVTILPTPDDATVTLIANGYVQEDNSIIVRENTRVDYTVEKNGYVTYTKYVVAKTFEENIIVKLVPYCLLTINPIPSDATVELYAEGYTQYENTISVPSQTYVTYIVSKIGLSTKQRTVKVTDDMIIDVSLENNMSTLTINSTPNNAIVNFETDSEIYTINGNNITVINGSNVKCTVYLDGYEEYVNNYFVINDTLLYINLKEFYKIIINTIPLDSKITITDITNTYNFIENRYYSKYTIVNVNDIYYYCNTAHISTSWENDISNWTEITPSIEEMILYIADGQTLSFTVERTGYKTVNRSINIKNSQIINIELLNYDDFCIEDDDTNLFVLENNVEIPFQEEDAPLI